ncbi:hypothetical protein DFH06DRAFT_1130090 [Mycena polygramma]|nr:hypothetical protein DFH06DRAFT_1130090 [Mycena polygramma]
MATTTVVSQLITTLSDHCSHHHLTTLELDLSKTVPPAGHQAQYAVTPSVLRPLLVFPNLSLLRVHSPLDFRLEDAFIDAIPGAWPKLRTFQLRVSSPNAHGFVGSRAGSITLSALSALARGCPLLYCLELAVDARVVPDGPHPASNEGTYFAKWEEVERLVPLLAAARSDEEKFIMARGQ